MAKIDYTFYNPAATKSELQALLKAQLKEASRRFKSARREQLDLPAFRQVRRYLGRLSAEDMDNIQKLRQRTRHLREFLSDPLTRRKNWDENQRQLNERLARYGVVTKFWDGMKLNAALRRLNELIRLQVFASQLPSNDESGGNPKSDAIKLIYEDVLNLDKEVDESNIPIMESVETIQIAPGVYRRVRKLNVDLNKYISDRIDELEEEYYDGRTQ